jgi:hypothetical protein
MPSTAREIRFRVEGYPPAKNEGLSMLGPRHSHASRVLLLLEAARDALAGAALFEGPIGLEVKLFRASADPWDATNYLGGIGDALEDKERRGALVHLGDLASVALYRNDRQIREIHFSEVAASSPGYEVRVFELGLG